MFSKCDLAGFIVDRALATVFLTHFDDGELLYYLKGTAREKREQNYRQGEPLSRRFGNIVLNCHANEEQWTEEYRERWVEQNEIAKEHLALLVHAHSEEHALNSI